MLQVLGTVAGEEKHPVMVVELHRVMGPVQVLEMVILTTITILIIIITTMDVVLEGMEVEVEEVELLPEVMAVQAAQVMDLAVDLDTILVATMEVAMQVLTEVDKEAVVGLVMEMEWDAVLVLEVDPDMLLPHQVVGTLVQVEVVAVAAAEVLPVQEMVVLPDMELDQVLATAMPINK